MPRFAFALPILPNQEAPWRAIADEVTVRHATEHRMFLRSRGIFKERWWMQTGIGTPSLTLILWDCDQIRGIRPADPTSSNAHERWLAEEVAGGVHGLTPDAPGVPRSELLSGTTTAATATAETQTLFALPIPEEGVPALLQLMERIEHGDLSAVHEQFLTDASIREEWIWLQPGRPGCPPLLLIHWIGDDLEDAWRRLTYVREDEYARVLHQALFTRLVGISPQKVAMWEVEQLLVMHVRRSDTFAGPQRVLGQRLANALASRGAAALGRLMASDVVWHPTGPSDIDSPDAIVDHLLGACDSAGVTDVVDVLIGESHVVAMLGGPDGGALAVLLQIDGSRVTSVRLLESGIHLGG